MMLLNIFAPRRKWLLILKPALKKRMEMRLSLPKLWEISCGLRACHKWRVTLVYPAKAFIERFPVNGLPILT